MPGPILHASCPCGLKSVVHPGFSEALWTGVKVFACPSCGSLRDRNTGTEEEASRRCERCKKEGYFLEDEEAWFPPNLRSLYKGEIPWLIEETDWSAEFRFLCPLCKKPDLVFSEGGCWD